MIRKFGLGLACLGLTAIGACGGDGTPTGNGLSSMFDSDGDGVVDSADGLGDADGDGVPAWQDPDESGISLGGTGASTGATAGETSTTGGGEGTTSAVATTGGTTSSSGTTSGTSGISGGTFTTGTSGSIGLSDAGQEEEGGSGGGPIVGISESKVLCGSEECSGNFACCEAWTAAAYSNPQCTPAAQCNPRGTGEPYDVQSECDGPEDCGKGTANDPSVCCFLLQGFPANLGLGPGPGLGRECTRASECFSDEPAFTMGRPQGIISCKKDEDCTIHNPNWSCQPEAAEDDTAQGATPRPHVTICK